ncbi:LacI family DNA-binding transcriptional regulator [Arthrobacter sp. ISL-30]|uniref:LacI family DNA-binding transcriptional regulator n=1 Tax=Arthrobacter sp. ISL-30 TaxID=2819109 RepID=UPI001BE871D0|nr:LacI family DNA-binding transcriptional regulator [Arthrobacter sp. ISL-30]MBT2514648.1 LacI family DNA-binding transcriptional regulator [Arthrobacter sp. ISL-30]
MSVTIRDVARVSGYSIKTVSNVINGHPQLRPETRQRVQDAIDQLGYRPNLSARNLRSGRSGVIGLIIPDLTTAYFAELADAVMRAAAARGLAVLIEPIGSGRENELAALRGQHRHMVDGVIYSSLTLGAPDAELLKSVDTPLVVLGDTSFNGQVDRITMANVAGARAGTEHLLASGRRRVLALAAHEGDIVASAELRLAGYRQAIEAAGARFDPELVYYADSWHRRGGAAAMRKLLEDGLSFDAIFAFNDTLALGAMHVLQGAGFRIPKDVAIVGFDDLDETRYSLPALSTINPHRDEIAKAAVDTLLRRIEGGIELETHEIETGFSLEIRDSSGPSAEGTGAANTAA